jgi:hypothetical protein
MVETGLIPRLQTPYRTLICKEPYCVIINCRSCGGISGSCPCGKIKVGGEVWCGVIMEIVPIPVWLVENLQAVLQACESSVFEFRE